MALKKGDLVKRYGRTGKIGYVYGDDDYLLEYDSGDTARVSEGDVQKITNSFQNGGSVVVKFARDAYGRDLKIIRVILWFI